MFDPSNEEDGDNFSSAPQIPSVLRFRSKKNDLQKFLPQSKPSSRVEMSKSYSYNLDEVESSESSEEESEVEVAEKSPYESILGYKEDPPGEFVYYVKLFNRPYRECAWVTSNDLLAYPHKHQAALRFRKKHPFPPSPPFYDPSYDEIDRVIAVDSFSEPTKYLVKWFNLNYDSCTWETEVDTDAVASFKKREIIKSRETSTTPLNPDSFKPIEVFPESSNQLQLFIYQLEGVNWLRFCWYNSRNCILADEMGLGKTVQAVAFLNYTCTNENLRPPYLIIAPLATLQNWQREFNIWTSLNTIIYTGNKESRNTIRNNEFFFSDGTGPKFDALITNYELIMNDTAVFSQFKWSVLIVDEAHRLKNASSKLQKSLSFVNSDFRILLTGTPIQNSIEELHSLLEFLHPGKFNDILTAEDSNDIIKLRNILKPHLLRRLKKDVDNTIAAKEETIIECNMTKHQKQFYRAILESNAGFLSHGSNLINIAMELRKVCIHPFLIKGAEDRILNEYGPDAMNSTSLVLDAMIRSSGKMILIDKLLPKLKADGHRILIFSQMTNLLDILSDYLSMKGYSHLRIDGKVRGDIRQQLIDKFNAPGSDIFIFLLCTRAGGLGINLNAADTVIIFDSDWNPQNDLQAQARCHRIGQTKTVKVYRLITKGTYEQNMFEIASRRLGLGHAVLDKGHKKEIDKLLRQGAYHALRDVEDNKFGEEDIEEILSRSKVMVYNEAAGSTFSKANFDCGGDNVDIDDPDFWKKILPANKKEDEEHESDDGPMKTRHRPQNHVSLEDDPNLDDGTTRDWKRSEREKLQHLLFWFGWDRWNDAARLTGLKRSTIEIKLASRAFLRKLILVEQDLSQYTTARMLLEKANSGDFDPNFINEDDAVALDHDFMRQSSMIDPDFVQLLQKKVGAWLKRIEMLYYICMSVEKSERKPDAIFVPHVLGNPPTSWWTADDDRYLIYGTWKNGFSRSEEIMADEELKFSHKTDSTLDPPLSTSLTPRIRKLAHGLKKYFCSENRHTDTVPQEPNVPKFKLWLKRDKSTVLQQMLHGGVPLKDNGDHDWAKLREICGFNDKTDDQMKAYVEEMMDTGEETEGEHVTDDDIAKEEDEKSTEGASPAVTAARIKQRFTTLTQLRRIFLKYSDEEVTEYFSYLPRWRNVPRTWTDRLEFEFFKSISERGWGVCGEILKGKQFDGVFEGDPPSFVTSDARVMRRLNFILEYFSTNSLEALRAKEAAKPKKKKLPKEPSNILQLPQIEMNSDGSPVMPLMLTSTAWVCSLGHIVTDRSGFHTERYIYPAGFKSSRLYASTLDPTHRVRYNCEIIDVGESIPLFRVSMEERPDVKYEGNSPTSPWTLILKRILEMRTENPKALSISGPDIYGLASPAVIYLIQNMEGADKCVNYIPRVFSTSAQPQKQLKRRTPLDDRPEPIPRPKPLNQPETHGLRPAIPNGPLRTDFSLSGIKNLQHIPPQIIEMYQRQMANQRQLGNLPSSGIPPVPPKQPNHQSQQTDFADL